MASEDDVDDAPETAFALIGNETRAAILRSLGEDPHAEVPFSELRSRVDEDLDSGQFNYHLKQLLGRFVDRTEDGYTLRPEGIALYRRIRAGTFTRQASVGPREAGFDCHFCGAGVEIEYDDGILEMECPGCDYQYVHGPLPPSAVETAEPEAALALIDGYQRHEILAFSRGVCPICVNSLDVEFVRGEDVWMDSVARLDALVHYSCDHCGCRRYLSVGLSLLYHPSLIAFFHDHGTDVTTAPLWELGFAMTDEPLTVEDTDPWRITFRVTRDGDTLELAVEDGTLPLGAPGR